MGGVWRIAARVAQLGAEERRDIQFIGWQDVAVDGSIAGMADVRSLE
jgi:hypothetical protein